MAEPIRIDVCGPLVVTRDGRRVDGHELGSRKSRVLLALLAVEPGALVHADRIQDVLWGSHPPVDPGANLATLVSRLRQLLGADAVLGDRSGYRLASTSVVTDLDQAGALVREALARQEREPATSATSAARALALLEVGPPVAEEPGAEWAEPARTRATQLRRTARHVLSGVSTALAEHEAAVRAATEATEADPYDERAHRDLMRALVADGRSAAALELHATLAARLLDELGVDPDEETRALQVAILRQEPGPAAPPATDHGGTHAPAPLIGREQEVGRLDRAWADAVAGTSALVLVTGESGIGKTRLLSTVADLATRTGGQVLATRCHAGESSLFLQPFLDLLRPALLREPPARLGELLGRHAATWATLVPELAGSLDLDPVGQGTPDVERRRAYDAVVALLRTLQLRQPLLVTIDDLQEAGAATVDLVGFLVRHLASERVLMLVAARSEAVGGIARLFERGERIDLGPLPPSAVSALAAAAGLAEHAPRVLARTAGHPLSVVESLRAINDGDAGVPASLTEAIMGRVDRLAAEAREGLQAAAVLGVRVLPEDLAGLLDETELATVRRCRALVEARLLAVRGSAFEFTNDLVQETVLASLDQPLARAYHRRAANVLVDRPEAMAGHAAAAGETDRAALGWLLAGEDAMRRSAVDDARALFERALAAGRATGRTDLTTRALLARARTLELAAAYDAALTDIDEALRLARMSGHDRLEMAAEVARGGDVPIALHQPLAECAEHMEAALGLATLLGDRAAEAQCNARLTVLGVSRLQLSAALRRATVSVARARASGDEDALVPALDGLKNVHSFLADADALARAVRELIPMLRRRGDLFLLQWAVFESSFVPASRGDWGAARALVDEAMALNRRSGFVAYPGYFLAHRGWLARLAGDLPAALADGRQALAETSPVHPWWFAAASGLYASSLVRAGSLDEAAEVASRGHGGTELDRPEAYRLRCLAPFAAATGDEDALLEATAILEGITAPARSAWVVGADTYLDTAGAWLRAGDPERARQLLAPLRDATGPHAWREVGDLVATLQNSSVSS